MFLALTAGSPIFKGKLADIDTRWDIIAASVDDRSPEERDIKSEKYYLNLDMNLSVNIFLMIKEI